jgi:hypothetical protein
MSGGKAFTGAVESTSVIMRLKQIRRTWQFCSANKISETIYTFTHTPLQSHALAHFCSLICKV